MNKVGDSEEQFSKVILGSSSIVVDITSAYSKQTGLKSIHGQVDMSVEVLGRDRGC